jgi:RNA polymerase sigma factor (TIGR02999 family)
MSADPPVRSSITQLLIAWGNGRDEALAELMPQVYEELRRIAVGRFRHELAGHTLQPTALVHEAYLRLVDQRRMQWRNRAQFYGVAAQIMRRILVDQARSRHADKRGAGWRLVSLTDHEPAAEPATLDVVALDQALQRLEVFDAQQSRIVELRYFGGLTIEETAEALKISPATVVREWTIARAWLRSELKKEG